MSSDICPYPVPADEDERLAALKSYAILETPEEPEFDRLVRLAQKLFEVPTVLISLVEGQRQWFKAKVGIDVCETGRDVSFCAHAIMDRAVLVVPDARNDARFADSPLVQGPPHIRFYAGAPLITPGSHKLGTLCLIDGAPRARFSEADAQVLSDLAQLVMDRMELRKVSLAQEILQQRFHKVTSTSPDAVICADDAGHITFWSPAAERLFGYSAREAVGQPFDLILPPGGAAQEAGARLADRDAVDFAGRTVELEGRRRDGAVIPVEMSLSRWRESEKACFGAIVRDITERKLSEKSLHRLAYFDEITKLPNRALFHMKLKGAVESDAPTTVMLVDIDDFSQINDTLGQTGGDAVLKELGRRLARCVADKALPARLSADEFGILLPGVGDPRIPAEYAERVLLALKEPFEVAGHTVDIRASLGAATCGVTECDATELMARTQLALGRAKASGGGRFSFFQPVFQAAVAARRALESELGRALENREFVLYYQPQVSLADRRLVGAEALLRWQHPQRGLVGPGAFISVLEESPHAADVGEWVMATACAQAATWVAFGYPPLRMGINLSAAQFRSGSVAGFVEAALNCSGFRAADLELEITETILLDRAESTISALRALRSQGVSIAFDDFGTGFASLSLLKDFPLTKLKIDRSFVRNILADGDDAAIVRAVLAMARSMELKVIAEGIEMPAQEAFLKAQGCDEGQGYYYGRPMPADQFEALLAKQAAGHTGDPQMREALPSS